MILEQSACISPVKHAHSLVARVRHESTYVLSATAQHFAIYDDAVLYFIGISPRARPISSSVSLPRRQATISAA